MENVEKNRADLIGVVMITITNHAKIVLVQAVTVVIDNVLLKILLLLHALPMAFRSVLLDHIRFQDWVGSSLWEFPHLLSLVTCKIAQSRLVMKILKVQQCKDKMS